MPVGDMNWQTGKVVLDSVIMEAAKQKYGIRGLLRDQARTLGTTRRERDAKTLERKKTRQLENISREYGFAGLWFHWLPEPVQRRLSHMPIREVKKWFNDPKYREACISKWKKEDKKSSKQHLPAIKTDLELLEKLLATYTAASKIVMEKKGQK
jgi:hypothetical protein